MKTKELLEARWKVITFALLTVVMAGGNVAFYALDPAATENDAPPFIQPFLPGNIAHTFSTYAWESWFATNGPVFLGLFAAVLGSGLIANEVNKGTIFFLLSKPVSRERILLTKYGVCAGLLLAVSVLGGIAFALMSTVLGRPQDGLHLLSATGLLWLATLFPLGIALFFSVILPDSLRPLVFALLITAALILLPAILPNGMNWSLWRYWSNLDAYLTGNFPLKEYLVSLVVALIPLVAALSVFRRKVY